MPLSEFLFEEMTKFLDDPQKKRLDFLDKGERTTTFFESEQWKISHGFISNTYAGYENSNIRRYNLRCYTTVKVSTLFSFFIYVFRFLGCFLVHFAVLFFCFFLTCFSYDCLFY